MEFYISQTKADNHAVREAACACIAELGTKVCIIIVLCFEVNIIYLIRCFGVCCIISCSSCAVF